MDQWKLYVEMADRVSGRRGLTNTFFLTLNTAIFTAIGTDDPVSVIRDANERAVELLDRAIGDLELSRNRILAGEPIAFPTVSDNTAASLRVRMLLDPTDAAVWTGTKRGTVFFIVRWLKNIRKTLAEGDLSQYDVFVLNYCNWERPGLGEAAQRKLVERLKAGCGVSVVHFANGAFNKTLPRPLSPHLIWRAVATLAK